jgi:hypothetical protein
MIPYSARVTSQIKTHDLTLHYEATWASKAEFIRFLLLR